MLNSTGILQRIKLRPTKWERCIGQVTEDGHSTPMPSSGKPLPNGIHVYPKCVKDIKPQLFRDL
jgi:hypothetical protein